jgi:hypothetical protein
VHLARARIGEDRIDAARKQRAGKALGAVHENSASDEPPYLAKEEDRVQR